MTLMLPHAGTYSLYIDAIQRSDRLCSEIWQMIQSEPEYAGKTTMFILPDFGRDSDEASGGNGFQHHRTGDAFSRTTWMMVRGAGVRENVIVDRAVESTDLVPTLGWTLRFLARSFPGQSLAGGAVAHACSADPSRTVPAAILPRRNTSQLATSPYCSNSR